MVILHGSHILQSHDIKLVLLAAAICALGSFITLFLFSQSREMHGQGRVGWLFLAGFAAGAVAWTTHFVALLAFQPNLGIGFDPALTGGAFFVAVIFSTIALAVSAYGPGPSGFVGGAIFGLGVAAMHYIAMSSLKVTGLVAWNVTLAAMGVVLCTACTTLALGRARMEGRNIQVIAPLFLASGICVMHFVGMAAILIAPRASVSLPPKMIDPTILAYFVAAMVVLLVGVGVATSMIARGTRKDAQTQLKNIADASVEGLILTDGDAILDVNESARSLIGPIRGMMLRKMPIWEILDFQGDRKQERFEAQLMTDSGPVPVEVIARNTESDGRGPPHLRGARPARAPRRRAAHPLSCAFRYADRPAEPRVVPGPPRE